MSGKFLDRYNRVMNKSRELGVSPGALEFYFATGKRYRGAKARGYGKPEEPVKEQSPWDELPSEDIIKGFKEDE